ncbi:hypothetical protein Cantr_08847 [Candida viswanathii]|uniref:Uncharacterized protein n=1 Tax=Candida viswanathii TaxID=5486 RepID=A0A367Y9Q4_9ASCO|nr:hypothetical protein Cantr_08847 [Candida viswanathii]
MMKTLPPALEYLEVPQKAFPNALSTATVRKVKGKPQKVPAKIALPPQQKVALPSTLKEFKLGRLDLDKSDPAKFDFDASDLPNLDTLRVSGNRSLRLSGKFPSNLTTMRLSYVSKLDLTHLDSLQSLTRLEITGGIGTHEFTFKLPESLKFLEVSTAELRKIHVNAPNLQELTLYGNEYGVLNESNFVIPMNLKKLSLGMCDIEQINVSLPSTLTELHLESNALQLVSDLPVGLKHLNLALNPLGDVADGLPSVFPPELETLDLSDSGVNEKWIRKLNLGSLTNFKSIDLSFNKFNQLDPSCFPESLVVLDMHKAGVWKLKTDFKSLVNLQQLDLSDNMVGPYSDSFKKKGGIFGDAIRFVSIRDTGIWESTAKALYEELLQKPDFEFLDIPEDMVPKFKTPSGLKIKKIGCLCEGYAKGGLFDFL